MGSVSRRCYFGSNVEWGTRLKRGWFSKKPLGSSVAAREIRWSLGCGTVYTWRKSSILRWDVGFWLLGEDKPRREVRSGRDAVPQSINQYRPDAVLIELMMSLRAYTSAVHLVKMTMRFEVARSH